MSFAKKTLRYFMPLGLIVLAIVVVIGMATMARSKRPERQDSGQTAVLVETIEAQARSLNFIVQSQGSVRPRTQTKLVAQVSGIIVSVSNSFVAGGFFRAGEVLLEIDPSDYRTALKRAEAAFASRKAKLAEEKSRSEQALKDWRNLGRAGDPPDLVMRKPQLADAMANVQAAEADIDKARRDLQRTRISVPYDGLLRERKVDIGQYVTPGTQLGVSFAVDTAEIRLPLAADDLAFLNLPASTATEVEDYPEVSLTAEIGGVTQTWEARLIRTEGVLDESSRVLYVVASVVDPYGFLGQSPQDELRMGTFVRAAISGRYVDNVIVLPRYVLRNDNTVLVANSERELEVRAVSVARAEARQVYITNGVSNGELVVTTTLDAPIPGTRLVLRGEASADMPAEADTDTDGGDDP
ncbi:MAG: efflux RND transporter periplasmic adaptor subunit [Xanthomonadales bacterium]|nr:efflux RND transporter periplasmic adaptor subunit [Xanthomonadales bacterium]